MDIRIVIKGVLIGLICLIINFSDFSFYQAGPHIPVLVFGVLIYIKVSNIEKKLNEIRKEKSL